MDTIYAPATAVIKSGVAVIRVSGPHAGEALLKLTKLRALPKPRHACYTQILHIDGQLIDESLVLWFPGPASFTGEDVVEFHLHGSRAIISQMLESLAAIEGLRYAEAGEFTRRAFENNKMDLTEVEGLADLIEAETSAQATQALKQMRGFQSGYYDKWRQEIIHMLALLEAYIDFPDEEIPAGVLQETQEKLDELTALISQFLDDNHKGEKLRTGLTAVILGAPNAGKSSLINALSQREVAIVSDIAGTTRDTIEVHLDLSGYPLTIVDTAGLRHKSKADDIEKIGIEKALERAEQADLQIILFNAENTSADEQSITLLADDTPSICVANKMDLAINNAIPAALEEYKPLALSLKKGEGLKSIVQALEQFAQNYFDNTTPPLITHHRHRTLLEKALTQLKQVDFSANIELTTEDLRLAAQYIGQITGHIDVEEILDVIFSSFCIGK
jgi:tRNA modification GTPase